MKGLLIKDFRFLMNQKSSMIIFLGLGLFFLISGNDISLSLAYCTMMVAVFTTSSISYDGFDNGMSFLMTLPIRRKTYAASKYVFSLVVVIGMGILLSAASFIANLAGCEIELSGLGSALLMSVSMAMIMAALMIPIYLKFGAEKSRYAMAIIVGAVVAFSFILERVGGDFLVGLIDKLGQMGDLPEWQALGGVLGVSVVVTAVSMFVSVRIMEKKEY